MIIINDTYQLKDYPCLYYLSSKLTDEQQCAFLCGLGSIFGLNAKSIANTSVLFAHASKGVLYHGGFNEETVSKIGADIFKKPFKDCNSLYDMKFVKKTGIKEDCCIMCPMSKNYLNARIESERMCLRYILFTGNLLPLEDISCFTSMTPIDNHLFDYGAIPFNNLLYNFLKENKSHGVYKQDELYPKLSEYIYNKIQSNRSNIISIKKCVKRELKILYDYDSTKLSQNEINLCQLDLMSNYKYVAPKIAKPDTNKEIPVINNINKRKPRTPKTNKVQLQQISLLPEEQEKPMMENLAATSKNNTNLQKDKSVKSPVKKEPKNITKSKEDTDLLNQSSNKNLIKNGEKTNNKCINIVPDAELQQKPVEEKEQNNVSAFSVDMLHYPNYTVTNSFSSMIGNCYMDDPKVVLNFMTDICSSKFVSVESVAINNRYGLLFMPAATNKFYYFDLLYTSSGYLYPALSDATKLKFLSLFPLPVISMLNKLGFHSIHVESLTALHCLLNQKEKITDYRNIFESYITLKDDPQYDFYQTYMPYYKDVYNTMISEMEKYEDANIFTCYNNGLQMDEVLGSSYDLSDIIYEGDHSIKGTGFLDYQFNYVKETPIIKPGILYVVNIPKLKDVSQDEVYAFLEKVSINVHHTPYKYIRFAKLLTFTDTGIVYYAVMDGDNFLDILLDVVRKNYKKTFNQIPDIKTYRIEYK